MDRRGFFKLFGAGVAGIALEQAIPLGRVWSFPSTIVIPDRFAGIVGRASGFEWSEERVIGITDYSDRLSLTSPDLAQALEEFRVYWYTSDDIRRLEREARFGA